MSNLLARARALAGPFMPELVKKEPVITTTLAGAIVNLAVHFGAHPSSGVTVWIASGTALIVAKIGRELVIPTPKVHAKKRSK